MYLIKGQRKGNGGWGEDMKLIRALAANTLLGRLQSLFGALDVVWENLEGHAHGSQHGRGDLALHAVLRLVLLAGLTAPAHHNKHGHAG